MAKMGSIQWHEEKIKELRATYKKGAKKAAADKQMKVDFSKPLKDKRKKPNTRFRSRVDYDFLKYIRVVFKWASDNNPELSRPDIEMLLYLYGNGVFSRKQFNDYHKLMGLYSIKTLLRFEKDGWIKLWRKRKGKEHKLYTLTQKAKVMCSRMHKFACGEEEIPDNPMSNRMARSGAPRINGYYLDIIKRMNKDKAVDEEE